MAAGQRIRILAAQFIVGLAGFAVMHLPGPPASRQGAISVWCCNEAISSERLDVLILPRTGRCP
jgi:hypothetical protein